MFYWPMKSITFDHWRGKKSISRFQTTSQKQNLLILLYNWLTFKSFSCVFIVLIKFNIKAFYSLCVLLQQFNNEICGQETNSCEFRNAFLNTVLNSHQTTSRSICLFLASMLQNQGYINEVQRINERWITTH